MNQQLARSFKIDSNYFSPAGIYNAVDKIGLLAGDVVLILTGAAASLAIILIIISGIKFVTSGGDPKKLAGAQSTLTYAIIGLVVVILAFVIIRIVQWFLRANIVPIG